MREKSSTAKGFLVFNESALTLTLLSDEDAAKAIKAACNYFLYGTEPENLTGSLYHAVAKLLDGVDYSNESYGRTVERNRKNVQKRWEKRVNQVN